MRQCNFITIPRLRWLYAALLFSAVSFDLNAQPLQSVEVVPVLLMNVSPKYEFVGRVEAANSVDILARVPGFIQQRTFQEGQMVTIGQPLYVIEQDGYQLALDDAQATRDAAQSSLVNAEQSLSRNLSLARGSVSQAVLEQSQAARDSAAASLRSADVKVSQARLNLSYTKISSPIQGRIGVSHVSVGGFVANATTVLARVVQMDPIRVVFSISDRSILDLRAAAGGVSKEELARHFKTSLRLSNGQIYIQTGEIEFLDNQVDMQTGTLAVRALFSNPDALLVPNQFVTVVVTEGAPVMKPVVPQEVVQQDQEGKYVLVAGAGDRAELRRIKADNEISGNWIVEEGLAGGERLITGNLQSVAEGMPLKVMPGDTGGAGTKP
ncbi:efflux RND transporter periplasmic adaptor subunit [Agrobacterium tumefaciens]|jgi:membrane fusion protein (multidrug efflux system)|uniref:efflux RND transporter periplasmic adaptor subunit n=1 Tax=Agrobacterium tumefaciens TaxID=358 RepID=UPI000DD9D564|nr:efflux RND transporter periplasmic adaptor subunit [Agrobacterium tumefaciens]UXU00507.1 efflux RND transporter periplasmic adaptor subunit [Agrobacterium tumefaciens]